MQDSPAGPQKIDGRWWTSHSSRDEREKQKLWYLRILVIVIGGFAAMRWFGLSFTGIWFSD